MNKRKNWFSSVWQNFKADAGNFTRHDLLVIAGTLAGVAAIIWLSVLMVEDEFSVPDEINPAFEAYIHSHTAGVVSASSTIQLRLNQAAVGSGRVGQEVEEKLFQLSPSISGKTYWKDVHTLEFIPDRQLAAGKAYQVKFALHKVLQVPTEYSDFMFSLLTMQQNYDVEVAGLKIGGEEQGNTTELLGTILTADEAQAAVVENMLHAEQEGNPLSVRWNHTNSRTHQFVIENISRSQQASQLLLRSSGAPLQVNKIREFTQDIPAIDEFQLIGHRVIEEPEQYVELRFSDALKKGQNLQGLIRIGAEDKNLRFITEQNVLQIYPGSRQEGTATLYVSEGISSSRGKKLKNAAEVDLTFEALKPAVRMLSQGVILPSTDGMVLPFEAVHLKAVDVTVIRVFQENITQFLQVNPYGGSQELRRVGRPVVQQQVPLNASGVTDLGKWNRFTLDLSDIMEADPGAMYQINIGFRKSHAVYACGDTEGEAISDAQLNDMEENWHDPARLYWDAYSDYYTPDFDWEQRDNPCSDSYYGHQRSVQKNLMASDLGIIAKGGSQGQLQVFVTDLLSTRPRYGVAVKVLNLQQQEIASGTTDGNGKVAFTLEQQAFLLIAESGKQRGYLRLDDGSSLPLSHFAVSGQEVKSGLKGFIYGDRGVWRPGDSLHLNFILEDLKQTLPEHHPVVFELKDPRGQLLQRIVSNAPVGSIYNFSTSTPEDAPTGNWTAHVQAGGTSFSRTVRIETIRPNRLKIALDVGDSILTAEDKTATAELQVAWLTGAAARSLKARYELLLTKGNTFFQDYPAYVFEDTARKFEAESRQVFEGELNQEGYARFPVDLGVTAPVPGVLHATFSGKVFEEGGNFSTSYKQLLYYPYSAFVGMKVPQGEEGQDVLLTGREHAIDLVTVNPQGNLVSGRSLNIALYKLDWQWWWDQSGSTIASYFGSEERKPVLTDKVRLPAGKAEWSFSVEETAWGRYYLQACDPASGHCAGQILYLDWPGYAGRDHRRDPRAASMLSFSAEKEQYQVGEEAAIHIPAGRQGRALVSLEDGSQVLESHWLTLAEEGETVFRFEVTEDMAPNIYVHVSLIQPHDQTVNDMPIRLYGVVPLLVENPQSLLQPLVSMPPELEPESEFTITVAEKEEKPMAYTIALVDEGLLDITSFDTPAPRAHFDAREALGVKTWDLYDDVIGAYGGQLARLLSVGGGEQGPVGTERNVRRFRPVVKFLGPFFLEKGQKQVHTLQMPNYVGSVRTMVIAAHEGAYGHTAVTTTVSKPLMVLGTLPRVLGPGERVKLPANVFVMKNSVRDVQVAIQTNELLTIRGKRSEGISFDAVGDKVVSFDLSVPDRIGTGSVSISAAAGVVRAADTIHLAVRNPNPPVTDAISTLIGAGESWSTGFVPIGMPGSRQAVLEISSIPPLSLESRLQYLITYPHGCVEQIVSAAFPQLFLADIVALNAQEADRIEAHVKKAITQLSAFQTGEGAFAYWPGSQDADEWATSYAGHFLLQARDKGFQVPAGLLDAWGRYQRRRAVQWGTNNAYVRDDLMQAYRLYTLALSGKAEQGAMNRLREKHGKSLQAQWRLAAAYVLTGQREAAAAIIQGLEQTVDDYQETYGTYGSDLRDKAMILETLSLLQLREQGMTLYQQISAALSNENQWMSTQTTAYALMAAMQFMQGKAGSDSIKADYAFNEEPARQLQSSLSVVQREIPLAGDGRQKVEVSNLGEGELYARIVLSGVPAVGEERAGENGLRIRVHYKGTDGEEINPATLTQGTDFVAEVSVYNTGLHGDYQQLALSHIVPSGWEIINTRLQNLDQAYAQDSYEYQDIRDDRVFTYFDLKANERKTFSILLHAAYAGRFYQPALYCEAMYDHTIHATTAGQWIEVVQP